MINTVQNFAEKAAYFFVILFGVLLPYNMLYSTLAVYPIAFFGIISIRKEKLKLIPKTWWIFSIIFLLNVVGYFYSTDLQRASYLLERQLLIFVFPLLLPIATCWDIKKINAIFICFTISCFAAVLFLLYPNFVFLKSNHWSINSLNLPRLYNHSFTHPLGIHATYLSIYVALSIIFLIDFIPRISFLKRIPIFVALIILLIGLYFMASRNTMLALLCIILFIYPLFRLKNKLIYVLGIVVLFGSSLLFINQNNYIFNRFSTDLIGDLKPDNQYTIENPEPRIMRWVCAIDLIKQKPIIGYGSGDEISNLMNSYKQKDMMVSFKEEFNTHNQYLSILIKNGIVGAMIFLGMMIYFFRLAISANSFVYTAFLILLSIGFITENIIDANKGIFFFAFFNTLLGYQILNNRKSKRSNEDCITRNPGHS